MSSTVTKQEGEVFHFRASHAMEARCDFCGGNIENRGYIYHQWREPGTRVLVSGASCEKCNNILCHSTNALQRMVLMHNWFVKTEEDPEYMPNFNKAVDAAKERIAIITKT